ncbi:MAG: rRNA pseudouridine synthase, partial [Myxococcales bacterium]|nr:rRNA pseudouridine synthase [Myxococcales bacterium]
MAAPTLVRLQRFIAQAGIAARRKAEELITSGRVTVDGKVVTELGTKVDPQNANVQVDGEPVAPQELFYIVFNKPKGCITAVTDDRGRETVMDYLPNLPVSVAPVGRLDFYSEGVLLLTNDGELAAKLLAPGSHVPKTYHVKVNGSIKPADLEHLRTGVTLDDGTVTAPAEVEELPSDSKHPWLAFTLYEGKSRQIHRMLEALGCTVTKLQRVAFANLSFHGLRVGDARELTQGELNELRETVGLDRRAGARGSWSASREETDAARKLRAQAQAEREAAGGMSGPVGGDDDDDEEVFERQLAARSRGGRGAAPSRDERPARVGRLTSDGRMTNRGRTTSGGRPIADLPGRGFGGRPSSGPARGRDDRPARGAGGGGFGGRPSGGARPSGGRPSGGGFGARPASG